MALAAMAVALTFGTGGAGGGLALDPAWLAFPVSLAMALGIGALIGGLNGILVVRFEINAFIVTLASYIWGRGLVVAMSGGRSVYGLPDALRAAAVERILGIPLLAWILIAVYVVFSMLLAKMPVRAAPLHDRRQRHRELPRRHPGAASRHPRLRALRPRWPGSPAGCSPHAPPARPPISALACCSRPSPRS